MFNKLTRYIMGYEELEITGGTPLWALNGLTKARIPFWNIRWQEAIRVQICILARDRAQTEQVAEQAMCSVQWQGRVGIWRALAGVFHRPILLCSAAVSLAVILFLPKFLWFYDVTGNETVPDAKILRTLDSLGVGPGIYGPDIHPGWIKDHVLQQMPELQWLTVTQNGCRARVDVRERPPTPQTLNRRGFANVIASRAGLITEQSVLAGEAVHQVGDIVLEGELLVSGLVNLETHYLVDYAQAEIFARTWRKIEVRTPAFCLQKQRTGACIRSLWIEFGNKRIKLCGNSGILHASCDKMINRKILSLPGKHPLPVALVLQKAFPYETALMPVDSVWMQVCLEQRARTRLLQEMRAGEILLLRLQLQPEKDTYLLQGTAECREMIAETVEAKWNEEDFKDD